MKELPKVKLKVKFEGIAMQDGQWDALEYLIKEHGHGLDRNILIGAVLSEGVRSSVQNITELLSGEATMKELSRRMGITEDMDDEITERIDNAIADGKLSMDKLGVDVEL